MKLTVFQQLRPASQASFTLTLGTYLLQHLDADQEVHLYHLAGEGKGFFVEVVYEQQQDRLVVVRSFEQPAQLIRYMAAISLPAGC